jgi:hypothetical protein
MDFVCKRMINNVDDNGVFDYIANVMVMVVVFVAVV